MPAEFRRAHKSYEDRQFSDNDIAGNGEADCSMSSSEELDIAVTVVDTRV